MSENVVEGSSSVWDSNVYKILSVSALLLIVTGTVSYHFLEDWSWVDSLYFSAVAVTTVGFGDLTPSTDGAKLFTVGYIFAGIGIVAAYVSARTEQRGMKRAQRSNNPVALTDS